MKITSKRITANPTTHAPEITIILTIPLDETLDAQNKTDWQFEHIGHLFADAWAATELTLPEVLTIPEELPKENATFASHLRLRNLEESK